jgi:predicted esterase
MASILSGYEYDIFISYRHNDNRAGWVTDFVKALQDELAATMKEPLSVYFDTNPHDGLLETDDVDGSLKEKIKCLIFIPIVSQTYCDPNSFAWQKEFFPFIEFARNDQFGLDIKLTNGNVTKRVLPIRIHEIDDPDKELFEEAIDGVLRPVDFIHKSSGVNRPLRAQDDEIKEIAHTYYYRNQVNKVANAIKGIVISIKKSDTTSPVVSASKVSKKQFIKGSKNRWIYGISFIAIALITSFIFYQFNSTERKRKIREDLLNRIDKMLEDDVIPSPKTFLLATEVKNIYPADTLLDQLLSKVSRRISIHTNPPGVLVKWKEYQGKDDEWKTLGITPLNNVDVPIGLCVYKLSKNGFNSQESWLWPGTLHSINLDTIGTNSNMIQISGAVSNLGIWGLEHLSGEYVPDFKLDRTEVSNKEFMEFIKAGGYTNKSYWPNEILVNEYKTSWEKVIKQFVDKTGRPGPSTWEAGTFPDGQDNHPVSGVSWFEASAYAKYSGKTLPAIYHWGKNAFTQFFTNEILGKSNMMNKGTVSCGTLGGVNIYGAHDMAGNVREWCYNATSNGERYILGGAYDDPQHLYSEAIVTTPFDRSEGNGFRCAKTETNLEKSTLSKAVDIEFRNYANHMPIKQSKFDQLLKFYEYDKIAIHARVDQMFDSSNYSLEKVHLNSVKASADEQILYLFQPKNATPPYKTIFYWPGSSVIQRTSFNHKRESYFFSFLLKNGYAVVFPVFTGTLEKQNTIRTSNQNQSVAYRSFAIDLMHDVRRSLDYLDSRNDIHHSGYGFLGFSWGGAMAPIVLAIEDRFKVATLLTTGLRMQPALEEVDPVNFLPHVKTPTLIINGKFDAVFPYEHSQKYFYNLLGTPTSEKKLVLLDCGHLPTRSVVIKETLPWFENYLRHH